MAAASLTEDEKEQVLEVLDRDRFADKAPAQAWAALLDEGCYYCSIRTMCRILESNDEVRERRAQEPTRPASAPSSSPTGRTKSGPGNITKLKSTWKGLYFGLYVMLDIFSRKVIRWEVHVTETGDLAKSFIANAIIANSGARPLYLHADNGTSMTSKPVSQLLTDLRINDSHSRPHASNDNPYSEAHFKTLKYCPVFPGSFASTGEARAFCELFFDYYNNDHRHSGIGLHTPQSVHDGTWREIRRRRQEVLDAVFAAASAAAGPRPTIESQETAGINQGA